MCRSASNDCVIGLARNLARIREVFEVNSAENCAKKRKEKFEKFSHREVLVESSCHRNARKASNGTLE